jgi:hypothetical protein
MYGSETEMTFLNALSELTFYIQLQQTQSVYIANHEYTYYTVKSSPLSYVQYSPRWKYFT